MNRVCHRRSQTILLFTALLGLFACSSNDAYLDAESLPPVKVPEALDKDALGQIYTIPEGDGRIAVGELKRPLPPTLFSRYEIAEPRINSFDGRFWLVVPKEAAATWSQLLLYLQARQIGTVEQDVLNAALVTQEIVRGGLKTGLSYRIHLEPGLHSEMTEIHVVNAWTSSINRLDQWPAKSDDPTHEAEFLQDLAKVLSRQESRGDSLIASAISFTPRIVSTTVNGEPVLEMSLSVGRGFHVLRTSLSGGEFISYDQDFVRRILYIDENDAFNTRPKSLTQRLTGFVGGIGRRGEKKSINDGIQTSAYSLDQLLSNLSGEAEVQELFNSTLPGEGKSLLTGIPGYLLIQQTVSSDKQRVYIRDGHGRQMEPAAAKVLLDTIKQQLF